MTVFRFMTAGASAALATALLAASPAMAQDQVQQINRGGAAERVERVADRPRQSAERFAQREVRMEARAEARSGGGERSARSERQRSEPAAQTRSWSGGGQEVAQRRERRENRAEAPVASAPQRDRSYGGNGRGRDWSGQRDGDRGERQGGWTRPGDRSQGTTTGSSGSTWQRDRSYGADQRSREWQRDRRDDSWRGERRDDARNYANGYRDGRGYDNRYGQNQRQWDTRRWRNDNRYDWYRYRAANRSLFSLGRYYAPYRGYSYSRVNIGFRLGSLFYGNRYWINDPWRYRLPEVYGPYRWIRYYDDALLVDVYSGQVVDVIHSFFW